MSENLANDIQTLLSGAIDNAVTAITTTGNTGMPVVNFRVRVDYELMLVTSVGTGTNWTVTRGIEGTIAAAHGDQTPVVHVLTAEGLNQFVRMRVPAGIGPLPYSGSVIPTGWLDVNQGAVSRTTYADLFAAIGTTWGAGDGSTTFNLPPPGRTPIGDGTATTVETIASQTAAANAVVVASNNTKWLTGMPVTVSAASGFAGLVNGSFFIVRVDATHISIATSLLNAQNGSVVTVTGTGVATFTTTWTARTLGEQGGSETKAMTSTELLAHITPIGIGASAGGAAAAVQAVSVLGSINSNSVGGNAAMNIKDLFIVTKFIISY